MKGCETWPITWLCPTEEEDPVLRDMARSLASQLLWAMSGYRIGRCTFRESYRPRAALECGVPYKDKHGNWRNIARRGGECCRILLTHRPVDSIVAVRDGGVDLGSGDYAVEGSFLRRRGACWTAVAPCDDPQVIVVYLAGATFPTGTSAAVGEVACEYLRALKGEPCKLPSRATSIVRQGVTVTLDRIEEFVKMRRIGLPITDEWLDGVRGAGPRVASRVYSPDLPRGYRT